MKLLAVQNYDDMSKHGAEYILNLLKEKADAHLGLATGSTPTGLYQVLITDHQENGTSYKQVKTFNLDEYVGLDGNHPQSYRYFMDDHFFNHVDIPNEQTHVPNGKAPNLDAECEQYENVLKTSGGVDLQILGIGQNGHIGFNEPGTSFESRTHVVTLDESTRIANSRFFESLDEVPTQALTMGIKSILQSKQIVLLASGNGKAEAIKRLFTEDVSEDFPASILKTHPNVVVIADQEALSELDINQVDVEFIQK